MDQIKLGKFISDVRNERKMTQDELAEKIGVSSGKVISKWECGNNMPDFETLIEISKALKITLYELSICKRIENPSLIDKAKYKFRTYGQLLRTNLKNKIIIISSIILGIVFGLSTIFAINNYKRIEVYQLIKNDNEKNYTIKGNIFVTKDYTIFNLLKIINIEDNKDYLDVNISKIQYEILDNEERRILLHNQNTTKENNNNLLQTINSTSFSHKIETKNIPDNPNLKLKITYNDERFRSNEIMINFKIDKIFENTL